MKIAAMFKGKKLDKRTLAILAGVALVVVGVGSQTGKRSSTGSSSSPKPGGGCGYNPSDPLGKTYGDLVGRIEEAVRRENPMLGINSTCHPNLSCARVVALALSEAPKYGIPVPLAVAQTRRESSFNPHVDAVKQALAGDLAIGPLQVKPSAFRDVGMDANQLLNMQPSQRILYSVQAGLRYMGKVRSYLGASASWCDVLQAYNVGPTAFKNGKRNAAYSDPIVKWAMNDYSELAYA